MRSRVPKGATERLEPCEGKLSRTVLRGRGDGNVTLLPDKHTLAREILRLAQAYRGTWSAAGGNQLANLRVGARPLSRALKAVSTAAASVRVEVMFFRLRITAGNTVKVIDKETDGWGVRALTITATDAAQLASDLWQASKTQPDAAVNLFLDEGAGEIDVLGADDWRFGGIVRRAA